MLDLIEDVAGGTTTLQISRIMRQVGRTRVCCSSCQKGMPDLYSARSYHYSIPEKASPSGVYQIDGNHELDPTSDTNICFLTGLFFP